MMETALPNFSFYENAEAFDNFHKYTSYYQRCQHYLAELLQAKPGELVIEIGSAAGATTRALAKRYPQSTILGVDFRPEITEESRRLSPKTEFPNLFFETADMAELASYVPWEGRYPATVCSLYAFHHIPDPIENKFNYARALYELPVDNLKVIIIDEITRHSGTHPDYPASVIAQWDDIAQEAYRSVLLNRYTELLNAGIEPGKAYEEAALGAAYTRDVELAIGETTSRRDDEFPVSEAEMMEIWLDAGFHMEFHSRINAMVDSIFVMTKQG
jgi:SAM-dependent methyltransferase